MIIQSAPPDQPAFVIQQTDHARMSGRLAAGFGNADFARLDPRTLVEYVVGHHDEGWALVDGRAEQASTGLPHHLTQTPLPYLLQTSAGSPDFNQRHHPFCGLLSSMHTYGLFNGRYGLSDFLFIDRVPAEMRAAADAMLAHELERQERLKSQLVEMGLAAWVKEDALFHNYKLLQFFDTLSLYFHMTHAEARVESGFKNVPKAVGHDATVVIRPLGQTDYGPLYGLSPYPFGADPLDVFVEGRYLRPQPEGADLAALLRQTPVSRQTFTLTAL